MSDDILERYIKYIKRATYGMLGKENKFMNNKEALQALLEGKKIRKPNWNKEHYLFYSVKTDTIVDEDGNYREFHCNQTDWELYKESIFDDEEKAYLKTLVSAYDDELKEKLVIERLGNTELVIGYQPITNSNVIKLASIRLEWLIYQFFGLENMKYYSLKELRL